MQTTSASVSPVNQGKSAEIVQLLRSQGLMRLRDHLPPEGIRRPQKADVLRCRNHLTSPNIRAWLADSPCASPHIGLHAYLLVHVANVDGDLGVAEVSEGRGGAIVLPRDGLLLASRPAGRADGRGRLS